MQRWFLLFMLALASARVFAIPEIGFDQTYRTQVLPFYETGRIGEFKGERNALLRYIAFDANKTRPVVVIAPGYNESFRKYAELAYDLNQSGYSIYILDHRGQGASQRFLPDPHKGYVDSFQRYVLDLKKFAETVVPKKRPRFLIGHSLGGAIAAAYLEAYPKDFRAAILSAPMFEINLGRDENLASLQLLALISIGRARTYAPGTGYYDPAAIAFEDNVVTQSRARYGNNRQILIDNPNLFLAGQTVRWVYQAINGSAKARAGGARIRTSVLVLQAGHDELVKPDGQDLFCKQAAHCWVIKYPQARHEILQETDQIRTPALQSLINFLH